MAESRTLFAIYDENSMVFQLGTSTEPLTDEITGAVQTTATVTLEWIKDAANATIAGVSFPVTLAHAGGGVYRAAVPPLALSLLARYTAKLKAVVGVQNQAVWYADLLFTKRAVA